MPLVSACVCHQPPVVARVEREALPLDPRTVHPREDRSVIEALRAAMDLP